MSVPSCQINIAGICLQHQTGVEGYCLRKFKILDICLISNYNQLVETNHIVSLISKIRSKANKIIVRELRARDIKGLSPSHGDILFCLFQSGSSSMMELAKKIDRDKSTLTALVKKLVAMGYIETVKDKKDSRVTLVTLTKKGRQLKPDFDEISKILLERTYGNCSSREKEVIVVGLEKLLRNM
jgi:MarR family transcriptional regulator, organic hydroperoxide resistance regulator